MYHKAVWSAKLRFHTTTLHIWYSAKKEEYGIGHFTYLLKFV